MFKISGQQQVSGASVDEVAAAAIRLVLDCDLVVECDTVDEAAEFCRLSVGAAGKSVSRRDVARSLFRQLHSELRRVAGVQGGASAEQPVRSDVQQMSGDDLALHNLVEAVPSAPEDFRTTMEIWHLAAHPKPPYTAARDFLRGWAVSGCGLVKIGGAHGPQWYRYDDSTW